MFRNIECMQSNFSFSGKSALLRSPQGNSMALSTS
jgi:hypothetical protein